MSDASRGDGVRKFITIISSILAAVSIVAPAHAQDTLPAWANSPVHIPRKALVIGIDKYVNATQLVTTATDVVAVTSALRDLHFDDSNIDTLYTGGSVTYDQLVDQVAAFAATIRPDDVVFVYYSGHGAERKGENYLIPSEAVPHPAFLGSEWVSVSWVVSELSKAKPGVIVLVLDACRADPFIGTGIEARDVFDRNLPPVAAGPPVEVNGLATTSIPPKTSMVIAYAAGYKQVAFSRFKDDPSGIASIYTRALVSRVINYPFLGDALADTENWIPDVTSDRQVPVRLQRAAQNVPLDGTKPEPPIVEEFWKRAVNSEPISSQVEQLIGFLGNNPASGYAPIARARLLEIKKGMVRDTSSKELVDPLQTNSPPPPTNFQFVVGSLQSGALRNGGATAISNMDLPMRSKPNAGYKLAQLKAGAIVSLIELKGRFAKILSPDGIIGWIGGVGLANGSRVKRVVQLSFNGPNEYADVADWRPLTEAARDLARKSYGATIRLGVPAVGGDEYQEYVARLRSLRIRDYTIGLGAEPANIVIVLLDPATPANTASVTVASLVK